MTKDIKEIKREVTPSDPRRHDVARIEERRGIVERREARAKSLSTNKAK